MHISVPTTEYLSGGKGGRGKGPRLLGRRLDRRMGDGDPVWGKVRASRRCDPGHNVLFFDCQQDKNEKKKGRMPTFAYWPPVSGSL